MIRRKQRTEAQEDALRYKQTAPISIGETIAERRERMDRDEAAHIAMVRDAIWLVRAACQLCRGARVASCMGLPDEMHEDPPRSATRGLPLAQRFNTRVCGRICAACHRDVTENRLAIHFADPEARFEGRVYAVTVERKGLRGDR